MTDDFTLEDVVSYSISTERDHHGHNVRFGVKRNGEHVIAFLLPPKAALEMAAVMSSKAHHILSLQRGDAERENPIHDE